MTEYIKLWLSIIENMVNSNTYKLAWGRALLELTLELEDVRTTHTFHFNEIATKMLKYYWNQLCFFQLKQSPGKKPEIVRETERCIAYVNEKRESNIPLWFDKAELYLKESEKFYAEIIRNISRTLKQDVSWRFKMVNKENLEIYKLDKSQMTITFSKEQISDLKEYALVLSQLLNYRWAQLLETYNVSPRIALKVKGISDAKIKRNNLTKYKDLLLSQMEHGKVVDFYSGETLDLNDISVDHVIPWSFMYSDDIWNLVITSKSNNSSKNNSIPSEESIRKLAKRNEDLLKNLDHSNRFYSDLKIAIENDYVKRFYLSLKM